MLPRFPLGGASRVAAPALGGSVAALLRPAVERVSLAHGLGGREARLPRRRGSGGRSEAFAGFCRAVARVRPGGSSRRRRDRARSAEGLGLVFVGRIRLGFLHREGPSAGRSAKSARSRSYLSIQATVDRPSPVSTPDSNQYLSRSPIEQGAEPSGRRISSGSLHAAQRGVVGQRHRQQCDRGARRCRAPAATRSAASRRRVG